jgi:uncharacterized membrane protein
MTKVEADIIESIAALPEQDRRRLVQYLIETNLDGPSFQSSMTPDQKRGLQQGLDQANRQEVRLSSEVHADIKRALFAKHE